ncbi:IclR family transcriptional regulator domain-containing protein, partial [Erwinia sp. MYb416]
CIAAPVFDIQQRVPYAVSVSLPTAKLQQIGVKKLMAPVVATAKAISAELGFHG